MSKKMDDAISIGGLTTLAQGDQKEKLPLHDNSNFFPHKIIGYAGYTQFNRSFGGWGRQQATSSEGLSPRMDAASAAPPKFALRRLNLGTRRIVRWRRLQYNSYIRLNDVRDCACAS